MGTIYVLPPQLPQFGVDPFALNRVSQDVQMQSCVSASVTLDAYFRGRYPLPFITYDVDITMRAAHIAIWLCLSNVGRNPEAIWDDQIDKRYEEAIRWAEGVQRQSIHPNVTLISVSAPQFSLPAVLTHCRRG